MTFMKSHSFSPSKTKFIFSGWRLKLISGIDTLRSPSRVNDDFKDTASEAEVKLK